MIPKLFPIYIFLLVVIFFSKSHTFANDYRKTDPIDSLEVKLVLVNDTLKLQLLNQLAKAYFKIDPLQSLINAKEAYKLAKKFNNKAAMAASLRNIGAAERYLLSDFDNALKYSFQALTIEEEAGLTAGKSITFASIAEIYEAVGNNHKALEYYMQSLMLKKEPSATIPLLNKIGVVYSSLSNFNKSLEYHEKALYTSQEVGDRKEVAKSISYIAGVYKNKDHLEKALAKHITALKIRQEIGDQYGQAQSFTCMGEIYKIKGDAEKAINYHVRGIKIKRKLQDVVGLAYSYNDIGRIYIREKNYERAIKNLELALQYGVEANAKKSIRDSYEYLYACHSALENYQQALEYKNLFIAISEFIYSEESERKMAEMQTNYEIDKKETEIEVLKRGQEIRDLELSKQENFQNFLLIGMVLLLIIAGLVFNQYRQKQKSNNQLTSINDELNYKNSELQELNATKDKFFSIISHDLKGPLNSLTSFSGLLINHTESLSKEEIKMLAKDLDKSVKSLFSLLENLLHWARAQSGNIDLKKEAVDISHLILQTKELLTHSAQNKNIMIDISPPPHVAVVMADKNTVNTVIRNLVSNALKFTHPGGRVVIDILDWKDAIEISIKDNGVGMSKEVMTKLFRIDQKHSSKGTADEKGTGLGLILCKEFVEKNNGTIHVESEEGVGTTFKFTLPKACSS